MLDETGQMKAEMRRFESSTLIATTLETILQFHDEPDALKKLTPPPLIVQIKDDRRQSLTQGSVDFVLWFGPIPVRWLARHEPGPLVTSYIATSFIDRMIDGPL